MMSTDTAHVVRVSRTIRAARQEVWNAWTRSEQVKKWSCPVPGGVRSHEADLRVGGLYELAMEIEGQPHTAFGAYREIDPPRRLVYTWDWREQDSAMGETLVTVEFEEQGDATLVTVTHEGFPAVEAKEAHTEGWNGCLANLEVLFA